MSASIGGMPKETAGPRESTEDSIHGGKAGAWVPREWTVRIQDIKRKDAIFFKHIKNKID